MPLSQKPLEQISGEDLAAVIQHGEAEYKLIDYKQALPGLFDAVWNACGHAGSRNFDESGKWKAPTK